MALFEFELDKNNSYSRFTCDIQVFFVFVLWGLTETAWLIVHKEEFCLSEIIAEPKLKLNIIICSFTPKSWQPAKPRCCRLNRWLWSWLKMSAHMLAA